MTALFERIVIELPTCNERHLLFSRACKLPAPLKFDQGSIIGGVEFLAKRAWNKQYQHERKAGSCARSNAVFNVGLH